MHTKNTIVGRDAFISAFGGTAVRHKFRAADRDFSGPVALKTTIAKETAIWTPGEGSLCSFEPTRYVSVELQGNRRGLRQSARVYARGCF